MKENRPRKIICKGLLALVLVIAVVAAPLAQITHVSENQQYTTTVANLKVVTTGSRRAPSLAVEWSYPTDGEVDSSPALGDVDQDGRLEIVIGSNDGRVYCLSGESGFCQWSYQTNDRVASSPVIIDVDGDSNQEVIVGSHDHAVYCLDSYGQLKWNYTTEGPILSSAVAFDLDGNGQLEVVIGSNDNRCYCLNSLGGLEWNFTAGGPVLSTPAVNDADGDGAPEVIIGSWDGNVYCLNNTGKAEWIYTTGDVIYSSPTIADIDGDGQEEVIIGSTDGNIYCLNGTGSLDWRFMTFGVSIRSSATIDDLCSDNLSEVVIGSNDGSVYCLNPTGGSNWVFDAGSTVSCSPALSDLNGDGQKEVVVGTWSGDLFCLGSAGEELFEFSTGAAILSSPVVADLKGDGWQKIVVGCENHLVYSLSVPLQTGALEITVYDFPSSQYIGGASVASTSTPIGQAQLFNLTTYDGLVTFKYIMTGSYEFEVSKDGYGTTILSANVDGGRINSVSVSLAKVTSVTLSSPVVSVIMLFAVFILLSVLLLRKAREDNWNDEGIPTQSFESSSQSDALAEVSQESNEPILSPRFCRRCGATYVRPDASYCWNCGAELAQESETFKDQGRRRKLAATIGKCMVCNLDVKENEGVVWCPYCGNMGHRTHMLEWLHTRNYCPECHSHLDETDLRSQ